MRQYESVKLKNEVNALREKGIDVNTLGVLILQIASSEQWIVMFLNPKNEGDYAVATVSESDLIRLGSLPAATIAEIKEIVNRPNFFEHTSFLLTAKTVGSSLQSVRFSRFFREIGDRTCDPMNKINDSG